MSDNDYAIIPVKGQKTYTFADTLPQHPSRMLLVGQSQLSGKSTVLFSLLSKRFPYFTFYGADNIYVICPTIYDDHRWKKFKIKTENISIEWDMEFIDMIKEKVSKRKTPTLLICDDVIPLKGTKRDNEPFAAIFTRGRHYGENKKTGGGLSIWVTTQYYKALPPVVRGNTSNLCVWLGSDAEAMKIYEEHSNGLAKNDWLLIYKYCTLKEHSFLHINYANSKRVDGRFCLRFESVLQLTGHDDEHLEDSTIEEKQIEDAQEKAEIKIKPKKAKKEDPPVNRAKLKITEKKVTINPVPDFLGHMSGYVPNA